MSDTNNAKDVFRNYISAELNNRDSLVDYIISQNMKKLMETGTILDNDEYRKILRTVIKEYGTNQGHTLQTESKTPNIITLKNKLASTIQNSNVIQYEYVENGKSLCMKRSAKGIYYNILEYLAKNNYDIFSKKYIPIATKEQWYEILGTSTDIYIETKYKEFMGHMLFTSITPANIMRKLTRLFKDLNINLDNLKIYLQDNSFNIIENQPDQQIINHLQINNTEKVGTLAKRGFTWLLEQHLLNDLQIYDLRNPDFAKNTFGVNYAILIPADKEDNRFINGYPRYYTDPIGNGKYFLCNDWYEKNMMQLKKYLHKFNKTNFPDDNS